MEEVFTVSLLGVQLKQNGVRLNHFTHFSRIAAFHNSSSGGAAGLTSEASRIP